MSLPTISPASEIRVDSTGGLTTVLDDETTRLDLFLDGNPAGLGLLNTRERFDISGQWFYSDQEGPWGANKRQLFSTLPRSEESSPAYGGLMLFPSPHWAFQFLGDAQTTQGVPVSNFASDTRNENMYRGLVRAAYALSFGSIGLEVLNIQSDQAYDAGYINGGIGLTGGSGSQKQVLLKAGFIATFPEAASPGDARWQAGGYFSTQLGSSPKKENINFYYFNSSSFSMDSTFTSTDFRAGCAEMTYEIPLKFKARFSATYTESHFPPGQAGSSPTNFLSNIQSLWISSDQTFLLKGDFRLKEPFSDTENFTVGGGLDASFGHSIYADLPWPVAVANGGLDQDLLSPRLGIGLESEKEYSVGLQFQCQTPLMGSPKTFPPNEAPLKIVNESYRLAAGGEKWLSPVFILRMGLVLENDIYTGGTPNALLTALESGWGLQMAFGRVDFRMTLGQYMDTNDSNNLMGIIRTQLAGTLFL
ncbi:MAG TPA: hypothetical protein VMV05_11875 [bacterium]|nr:hypothetical protein [bacterium]